MSKLKAEKTRQLINAAGVAKALNNI